MWVEDEADEPVKHSGGRSRSARLLYLTAVWGAVARHRADSGLV